MMAWSVIRKATDEDRRRLWERTVAFCKRHGIEFDPEDPQGSIDFAIARAHPAEAQRLRRLWTGVVRRALREPHADGIAWGMVGMHVD